MPITWNDFDKIWAVSSPLTPYTFSDLNYAAGWDFIGSTPPARQMWDSLQKANDEKFKFLRDNFGTPNMVTTAAQMTDTDKIYVYVGSEAGWNNGHWYYYDAGTSAWVDGGVYNSTAFVTDTTLTEAGKAADAKAVGDALALKADLAGATFTGNVAVNADFSTTGDATVASDLTVSGATTLTGNVTASGNVSVVGDIDADNITLTGDISATDVTASGDVTAGSLSVSGATTLTGNVTAGADITATGDVTANDASFANATLSGTLSVTGATTLDGLTAGSVSAQSLNTTGNVTVGGTLTVSGATTLADITTGDINANDITATGDISADDITANTLTVSGASTLTGNITAGADITVTGDLSVTDITASGDITADDVTANGNLSVVGNATLNGTSTAVTPAEDDNSTKIATTAYVQNEIKPIETDVTINDKRISNIEKLLQGNLYDYQTDSDSSYTKTVPQGAMPYASLDSIGGKTVVFNQLVQNGNFESTTGWVEDFSVISVSDNILTMQPSVEGRTTFNIRSLFNLALDKQVVGHKYLVSLDVLANINCNILPQIYGMGGYVPVSANTWTNLNSIYTLATITTNYSVRLNVYTGSASVTFDMSARVQAKNYKVFDLTLMFGAGNEPSTYEEFQQMFPADWYPYNAGQLLSAGVTEVVSKKADTTTLETYPIPAEIQALEGYGWSAGSVYNYIDYERKVFVKNVGSVDLGSLAWSYVGGGTDLARFITSVTPLPNQKVVASNTDVWNAITSKYETVSYNSFTSNQTTNNKILFGYTTGVIGIKDLSYTDAVTFKTAMNGVYLYYELEAPQETDISAYITDDNLIEVESGGTLTFENQHGDDYRIDVPSSETYMVDLQSALGE